MGEPWRLVCLRPINSISLEGNDASPSAPPVVAITPKKLYPPINLGSASMDLETLRQSARMDMDAPIRRTLDLIDQCKVCCALCKPISVRHGDHPVASLDTEAGLQATSRGACTATLSLVRSAGEYGCRFATVSQLSSSFLVCYLLCRLILHCALSELSNSQAKLKVGLCFWTRPESVPSWTFKPYRGGDSFASREGLR